MGKFGESLFSGAFSRKGKGNKKTNDVLEALVFSDPQLWSGRQRKKYGEEQLKEAEGMKPADIKYDIPPSVLEAVSMYKGLSKSGLPGEDVIRDQMGAAYAGAASNINRTADSGVGALGAMSGLYGRYMNSVRDLGVQSAQMKAQNQQNYILQNANAGMQLGEYTDKAWEYNTNIPFQRKMNEYWATKQAGASNLWGGIDQVGAGITNFKTQALSMLPMAFGGMPGGGGTASQGGYNTQPIATGVPQTQQTLPVNNSFNYSWGNWGNNNYGINRPGGN